MQQSDVTEWVIDEATTVLKNSSAVSVSTPADHVDIAQARDPPRYPFVGVQPITTTHESAGIGSGIVYVDSLTYDNSGVLTSITYRREPTIRLNVIPVTDDDPKARDQLATELVDHFSVLARNRADGVKVLPNDMDAPEIDETSPQNRTGDFVWADGVRMEIPYERYYTDDDPVAAEAVNIDIDVGDTADVDNTNDADAFTRSFT